MGLSPKNRKLLEVVLEGKMVVLHPSKYGRPPGLENLDFSRVCCLWHFVILYMY